MSTLDPTLARQTRRGTNRPGRPMDLGAAILWFLMIMTLSVMLGLGLSGIVGIFHAMAFADIGSPSSEGPQHLWMFFVGLFGGILADLLYFRSAAAYTGASPARRVTGQVWLFSPFWGRCFAMAGGFWLGSGEWETQSTPGTGTDVLGAPVTWGAVQWIAYYLPVAVTGLLMLAGFFFLIVNIRSGLRFRTRIRVAQTGITRPGVVTEVSQPADVPAGTYAITVTTRYTDHAGVTRWATTMTAVPHAEIPREGDPASVTYDPADPGNQTRMTVIFPPTSAPPHTTG